MFSMNSTVELEKCRQLLEELRSSKYLKCNYMFLLNNQKPSSDENGLIDGPLDLEDIRKNLQRRKYFDREDFAVDMRRMCKAYRDNKENARRERELSREFETIFEKEFAEKFGHQRMSYDEIDDLAKRIKKLPQWNFDSIINIIKNNEPRCQDLSRSDIRKIDLRYIKDSTLTVLKSYVEQIEADENMNANLQSKLRNGQQNNENGIITERERNKLFETIDTLSNEEKLNIIKLITDYEYTTVNLSNLQDSTILKLRDYVNTLRFKEENKMICIQGQSLCKRVNEPMRDGENAGYHQKMEEVCKLRGSDGLHDRTEEAVQSFIKEICKRKKKPSDRILKVHN
ncbi:unnamed protein product [Hymenolepis diminuta]|uniref:Bromo domain-containing protein n=1 Tax=Hymenolepis diminuta TaxID=6216 RepID=A0A564YM35_HYMDI|nr:unnamed protein product [Hymenolepis diminuta]